MSGLTRRTFLKAGIAGFSSFALGPTCLLDKSGICSTREHVSLFTGRLCAPVPSTCGLCPAGCGILGFVEEGELVGLAGNPEHPYNRGALCALGSAGMNLVASAPRILKPLRRKGDRGEGRWEEISWEEALGEVGANWKALREEAGRGSLVISAPERQVTPLLRRFLAAFGNGVLAEADSWEAPAEKRAYGAFWEGGVGVPDLGRAARVLNFGGDPLGSPRQLVGAGRQWAEASGRGCRWITLDPRLSATAARSDRWIPLKPGTDGFLALAIAHEILRNGWEDRAFLQSKTDVDREGLWQVLSEWTPERAASVSQVPPGVLEKIAEEFAKAEGAVAIFGSGVTARAGGVEAAQAVLLLNFLTGNIERRGGCWMPRRVRWQEPDPKPPEREAPVLAGTLFWDLERGNVQAGCLLSFQTNPALTDPECGKTAGILKDRKRIPYHVAMVTTWNETARLADLVLPAATYLESWSLAEHAGLEPGLVLVSLRQPVIEPRAEARPLEQVLLDLAGRMGGGLGERVPFETPRRYYERLIQETFGAGNEAVGLEALRARGFSSALPDSIELAAPGDAKDSAGGQGEGRPYRIGRVLEGLRSRFASLLKGEAAPGRGLGRTLILHASPTRGDETAFCKWVAEIDHDDPLWMHPLAAGEIGCRDGDWVAIQGPGGEIETRVRLTEGIHPDAVAMASWPGDPDSIALSEAGGLAEGDPDRRLIWWKEKSYGGRARSLVAWPSDPHREAPGWMDTLVTVKRIPGPGG